MVVSICARFNDFLLFRGKDISWTVLNRDEVFPSTRPPAAINISAAEIINSLLPPESHPLLPPDGSGTDATSSLQPPEILLEVPKPTIQQFINNQLQNITVQKGGTSTSQLFDTTSQQLGTTLQQLGTTSQQLGTTSQQLGTTTQQSDTTSQQSGTTTQQLGTTSQQSDTTTTHQLDTVGRVIDVAIQHAWESVHHWLTQIKLLGGLSSGDWTRDSDHVTQNTESRDQTLKQTENRRVEDLAETLEKLGRELELETDRELLGAILWNLTK